MEEGLAVLHYRQVVSTRLIALILLKSNGRRLSRSEPVRDRLREALVLSSPKLHLTIDLLEFGESAVTNRRCREAVVGKLEERSHPIALGQGADSGWRQCAERPGAGLFR